MKVNIQSSDISKTLHFVNFFFLSYVTDLYRAGRGSRRGRAAITRNDKVTKAARMIKPTKK